MGLLPEERKIPKHTRRLSDKDEYEKSFCKGQATHSLKWAVSEVERKIGDYRSYPEAKVWSMTTSMFQFMFQWKGVKEGRRWRWKRERLEVVELCVKVVEVVELVA